MVHMLMQVEWAYFILHDIWQSTIQGTLIQNHLILKKFDIY